MIIERSLIQKLKEWKDSSDRKPLILNGVRQCGKTWLLKHFGQQCFDDVAYFNFEHDRAILSFFEGSYDPARIITQLSAFADKQIMPQKTLLIFDEIQVCPRAMVSLKYFCEDAPEYAIADDAYIEALRYLTEHNLTTLDDLDYDYKEVLEQ